MIRCLAIDDESLALDLIEDNIRKIDFLELVGKCRSAFEAIEILHHEPIDLIFLDIQMPDITGIQFLKSMKTRPLVIITTAYEKYALEGFELDVMDYLLKPFSFDRFLKAVTKANEYLELNIKSAQEGVSGFINATRDFIFVKSDYKLVRIDFKEIFYIEGLKDYVKIYCGDKPVVTLISMKQIEERLPTGEFIRVHRSFIIAVNKIKFVQKSFVQVGDRQIPISDNYKDALFRIINKNKLNN